MLSIGCKLGEKSVFEDLLCGCFYAMNHFYA